jgi:outer membrane protein TolC
LTAALQTATAQSIDDILNNVAAHNPEIRVARLNAEAGKQESRAANNLSDPTVSYARQWGKEGNETSVITELEVAQSFDFPTAYVARHKVNAHRAKAFDAEAESVRRRVLLEAKELCIDIIGLRQEQLVLRRRLADAQQLADIYKQRLTLGDATILDVNKTQMELLGARTNYDLNERDLQTKLGELQTLNGGEALALEATEFPSVLLPTDKAAWRDSVALPRDADVARSAYDAQAAEVAVGAQRMSGLPKLQVGFRRDTDIETPYNGVVVGFSIPLFENRGKVKQAKATAAAATLLRQQTLTEASNTFDRLYDEATALANTLRTYEQTLNTTATLDALRTALDGGELSLIVYLGEASSVYELHETYIELQMRYQKLVAQLMKERL